MSITRDLLQHALTHAGEMFGASDLAKAAGHQKRAGSASALLLGLLAHKAISRSGDKWSYEWFVPDTDIGRSRAQAYLDKPEHGTRNRNAAFNGGSPRVREPRDETPRENAFPPSLPLNRLAIYPREPLQFLVDDDGDMQIIGKITGTPYLLIPKLDAVDLLAFARAAAGVIEGTA